ncbi:MAG: N-acyl homoserine lactone hydrolase [Solirubrobacteraceae bacterium]|jgi:glyoxylase-like metal-dependent hydrolase (beta-lactamase superfamily II)|nr:N-acyl homoserine lactone hydrolase [Solirubrobacteraceae bacterium]
MTSVRRIIPLTVGWERLPKSYSVHGDTSGEILTEPVGAVLLDTADGWALIDTGINSVLIRDRPLYERMHGRNHDIVPILPETDGEPLEDALAEHGVALADITRIFLSHLHNDHAGGLRLFDPSIPVWVQRAEYEYGMSGHPFPEQHGMFRIDYDDPLINWQLMDGDTEIAPGIETIFTPGHTPGHQSFLVTLPDGSGYALACDAADLVENIEREIAPGGFVLCEADVPLRSLLALKAAAAQRGFEVVPWHDPVAWPAFTAKLISG